jgi:hypothetical protein
VERDLHEGRRCMSGMDIPYPVSSVQPTSNVCSHALFAPPSLHLHMNCMYSISAPDNLFYYSKHAQYPNFDHWAFKKSSWTRLGYSHLQFQYGRELPNDIYLR